MDVLSLVHMDLMAVRGYFPLTIWETVPSRSADLPRVDRRAARCRGGGGRKRATDRVVRSSNRIAWIEVRHSNSMAKALVLTQ